VFAEFIQALDLEGEMGQIRLDLDWPLEGK